MIISSEMPTEVRSNMDLFLYFENLCEVIFSKMKFHLVSIVVYCKTKTPSKLNNLDFNNQGCGTLI